MVLHIALGVFIGVMIICRAAGADTIIVPGDLNGDINTGPNADILIGGDTGEIYAGNNTIINAENITLECPDGTDCKGDQGEQGPPGEQGPAGEPGQPGDPGPPGEDGNDGANGQPGAAGKNGKDGKNGKAGPKGDKGDQGPQGPPGEDNAGGIAGALALGRIEYPRQGNFVIGLGAGYYKGNSAIAIGAGKAWEQLSVDIGAFYEDGTTEIGVAGSVNWHFK